MMIRRSIPRRGFSMAEMLVVIGILALLASLAVYAIGKARKGADKQRLTFQLQTISAALEAYQTDFQSYPLTISPAPTVTTVADYYIDQEGVRGARLLCKALMGQCGSLFPTNTNVGVAHASGQHQDGKVGLGFAVPGRSGIAVTADNVGNLKGKTYGPYLAADKFPISNTQIDSATGVVTLTTTSLNTNEKYDDTAVLLDGNGNPILYWPCLNPQAPITTAFAYVSIGKTPATPTTVFSKFGDPPEPVAGTAFAGTPMYNGLDNSSWIAAPVLRMLLGDVGDPAVPASKGDKKITGAEVAAVRGKFILWSAGPDGTFGPQTQNGNIALDVAMKRPDLYDDVTNFQGQ